MNRSPNPEIIETLTFPMLSAEIQTGDIELTVTCRIAWDMDNGMYCESLAYNYDGQDFKFSSSYETIGIDRFIKKIVASEYTAEHLDNIMREHPAFEEARNHEFDLLDIDRYEYREAVL